MILWVGIGEAQKLSVIFIGSFFQLVLMIAVTAGNTRRDLVEAAYTLGVSDRNLIRRVLIPGAAPGLFPLVNPKAWIMAIGAIGTYVPSGSSTHDVLVIALIFGLINAPCMAVWAGFGEVLSQVLTRPLWRRVFNTRRGRVSCRA